MSNPLHPSVRAAFAGFTEPLEGRVRWIYLDILGLPTTGRGNLLRSVESALVLPWLREDGTPATHDEIRAEWQRVKDAAWLAEAGHMAAERLCKLHLSDEAVDRLTVARLSDNAQAFARGMPGFADWPAAAQLGAMSMCWAAGTDGVLRGFPRCCAAMARRDFAGAAAECTLREAGNAGLVPRNAANRNLFLAAAYQQANGADSSVLLMAPPPGLTAAQHAAAVATLDASLRTSTGDLIEDDLAEHRRRT